MEIYLDIETIPCQKPGIKEELAAGIHPPANYSKPETITKWEQETKPGLADEKWRETAMNGALGQIYCIGYAFQDTPVRVLRDTETEADLIIEFSEELLKLATMRAPRGVKNTVFLRSLKWVGHNIRDFDLRFLFHRCVVHRIKPFFPIDPKPISDYCYDTMIGWAGYGGRISLDRLCYALHISSDDELKGAEVWDSVCRGEYDRVVNHCQSDVEKVRNIYKRLNFLWASTEEK
jgi:hypothetical protein